MTGQWNGRVHSRLGAVGYEGILVDEATIQTPDTVETRIGKLEFTDGAPSAETVEKVYDQLDFSRGTPTPFTSGALNTYLAGEQNWSATRGPGLACVVEAL